MTVPILFLHGWAMRGTIFDGIAEQLGNDFDCHAPDLPGHGERSGTAGGLDACADLAGQWIEQLNHPIVIGWSMGAAVAWRYLSRRGTSNLRALVTVDMSPRLLPDADWDLGLLGQNAETILATSAKIVPEWNRMVGTILGRMHATNSEPFLNCTMIQELLLAQDPANLRPVWNDLVAMDERSTIATIDIPYLVCTGVQSQLYSHKVADWIVKTAGRARLQRFANSGHSPHLEEPDAFCDAIRRFVVAEQLAVHTPEQEEFR